MQKVVFLLIFLYLFISSFRPINAINDDLGRHILLGNIILQSQSVPKINLLSYVYPDYPFINSPWLSEVIFASVHNAWGFDGLLLLATSSILLSFAIISFFIIKRYSLTAFLLSSPIYMFLVAARTDIRPELFSYLLLSIFITSLFAYREKFSKLILLLIPLEILWVNMHIYFFIGILLLVLFFIDQLIQHAGKPTKQAKLLGITLLFSTIGTLGNPNGIQGALFPFIIPFKYGFPVTENQNIFVVNTLFPQPTIIFLMLAILMLFSLLVCNKRKTAPIDWLLALVFSLAVLAIYRNITLFAYATLIPFAKMVAFTLPVLTKRIKKHVPNLTILKTYCLCIFMLLLIGLIAQSTSKKGVGFGLQERGKAAVDFFLDNHLQGPIFNDFNSSGYLAYRIYPQKVFLDNRPEAYPKAFFANIYLPLQNNPQQFGTLQNKYHFNTLILSHWDQTPWKNPLLISLLQDPTYALVYLDDYALILVRDTENNKRVMQTFHITENTFSLPKTADPHALVRYMFFFEKVGWNKQEQQAYQQLLTIDPKACILKKSLSSVKNAQLSLKNFDQTRLCP